MKYILITLVYSSLVSAIVTQNTTETIDTFVPTCCSADGCESDQRVQLSGTFRDPGSAAKACITQNNAKVHHIDASTATINTNPTSTQTHQALEL